MPTQFFSSRIYNERQIEAEDIVVDWPQGHLILKGPQRSFSRTSLWPAPRPDVQSEQYEKKMNLQYAIKAGVIKMNIHHMKIWYQPYKWTKCPNTGYHRRIALYESRLWDFTFSQVANGVIVLAVGASPSLDLRDRRDYKINVYVLPKDLDDTVASLHLLALGARTQSRSNLRRPVIPNGFFEVAEYRVASPSSKWGVCLESMLCSMH
jgi:hypothetical protein